MKRHHKPYRPRAIRIPMMSGLHNAFAMQLHTSLATLRTAPSADAFDAVGTIFNIVGLTLEGDARFMAAARKIAGGAAALQQIEAKVAALASAEHTGSAPALRATELGPIEVGATTIDSILPRLDVTKLHLAQVRLAQMRRAAA